MATFDPAHETPERSADGRHIVVDGRRWRATNPNIPEELRAELVRELMAARRAVKAAKGDVSDTADARSRVQNAKVALGERGAPWWEPVTDDGLVHRIEATLEALLFARGKVETIKPAEVARIVGSPNWRDVMPQVGKVIRRHRPLDRPET